MSWYEGCIFVVAHNNVFVQARVCPSCVREPGTNRAKTEQPTTPPTHCPLALGRLALYGVGAGIRLTAQCAMRLRECGTRTRKPHKKPHTSARVLRGSMRMLESAGSARGRENDVLSNVWPLPAPCSSKSSANSQAGCRRFDPGLPLHFFHTAKTKLLEMVEPRSSQKLLGSCGRGRGRF